MRQTPLSTLWRCFQQALDQYHHHRVYEVDLSRATIRNYLEDVRLFMAWCERRWCQNTELDTTLIFIQGTQQDLQQAVEQIAWE